MQGPSLPNQTLLPMLSHRFILPLVLMATAIPAFPAEPFRRAPDVPPTNPALLSDRWPAHWIAPPDVSLTDYGMFLFRKHFTLPAQPASYVIHISADNRYRLFVNGTSVTFGPQRGDVMRWPYDSVDVATHLHAGENVLAVQVGNYGENRPYALMSLHTGLIVQGDGEAEAGVNTDDTWRVRKDAAYAPLPVSREKLNTFIVVGPGEQLDAIMHPWGWELPDFDDTAWLTPRVMEAGLPFGYGTDAARWLVPRTIPLLEETPQRFAAVRRTTAAPAPGREFLAGRAPWVVPPKTKARLLLDQGFETNAFPELVVSGGRGADITLAYAEALFDANGRKGNRDEVEGRQLRGVEDRLRPNGGVRTHFTTLDYRTFRYLELRIETRGEPATIDDIRSVATGYPFYENGSFTSDDPELARIWTVGWRTARLCAGETYMDCPYYERLQYIGDTRIQALISLYVSGDDRLLRNAITLFDQSRIPEGLTQSRYPSHTMQLINTFSLFWIGMVHDYWMHRDDVPFVAARLPGLKDVLAWFDRHVDAQTGLLGPLPFWTFVDWPDEWKWDHTRDIGGEPPGAHAGGSSIVTLQYAMALDQASDLVRAYGENECAADYTRRAAALRAATLRACWNGERRLLADTPEQRSFSQHANALAILSGAVTGDAARDLITRVLADRFPRPVHVLFPLLSVARAQGRRSRRPIPRPAWPLAQDARARPVHFRRASRTDAQRLSCLERVPALRVSCHRLRHRARQPGIQDRAHRAALGETRARRGHGAASAWVGSREAHARRRETARRRGTADRPEW